MKILNLLERRINELKELEWQAKEARDYSACLQLYGAVVQLKKFLREVENEISNGSS